jgi:hypothetical protein
MQDIVYVAVIIAFFGIAALFVVACDKIIGADEEALTQSQPAPLESEPFEAAA